MYYRASRFLRLSLLHRPLAHRRRGGIPDFLKLLKMYVCPFLGWSVSWVGGSVRRVAQDTCGWGFTKPQTKVFCVLLGGAPWLPQFSAGLEPRPAGPTVGEHPDASFVEQPARSPLSETERHKAPAHHTCIHIIPGFHTPHLLADEVSSGACGVGQDGTGRCIYRKCSAWDARKSHAVLPPGLWPIAAVGGSVIVRICSICMSGRVSRLVCVEGVKR